MPSALSAPSRVNLRSLTIILFSNQKQDTMKKMNVNLMFFWTLTFFTGILIAIITQKSRSLLLWSFNPDPTDGHYYLQTTLGQLPKELWILAAILLIFIAIRINPFSGLAAKNLDKSGSTNDDWIMILFGLIQWVAVAGIGIVLWLLMQKMCIMPDIILDEKSVFDFDIAVFLVSLLIIVALSLVFIYMAYKQASAPKIPK